MEHYIHFEIETKKLKQSCGPHVNIYPLPCFHIGAPQCDVLFIKEHLKRVADDPNGFWIYMGDGGECVTRLSKGHIFSQIYNPTEQQNILTDILSPIKHKGLFALRGNHGNRIYKETGLSFDMTLAYRLGLPYLDVEAYCNIVVNRSSYNIYCNHGIDSGASLKPKVTAAENFLGFVDADIYLTAHSHITAELPPASMQSFDNRGSRVHTKFRYQYVCGTGYDSRDSYATEHGYRPLLPGFVCILLDGRIISGEAQRIVQHQIWRSDGQHKVNGRWDEKYLCSA
jgi:hypothetical protein